MSGNGHHALRVGGILGLLVVLAALHLGCGGQRAAASTGNRVIILGFDGMDHALTRDLMAAGRLPNMSRLAAEGTFAPLGTSVPPLSPVAWSNFITGLDPGGHAIFDFMHRDPETLIPYLSTSRTEPPEKTLALGKWVLPLSSGKVELLRRGMPFWEILEEHGVETTVIRIPANFPPSETASREISGMGTPDILGTYGTFSFYTSELFAFAGQDVSGGNIYELDVYDNIVEAELYGPDNPFLAEPQKVTTPFTVYLDPERPLAKLVLGDEERLLQVGEWSDWVQVEFDLAFFQKLSGMVRFYLKQVRPEFELYVTPINIDPLAPALPVSHPQGYAGALAEATGLFYTQGMPEDTKALTEGVLGPDEFLAQARLAHEEYVEQFEYLLGRFEEGLFFYYFGNLDQVSHVMWRSLDPQHPAYDPEVDPAYADVLPQLYQEMDRIVGYTVEHMPSGTRLVVMSDHGFTSWRRAFSLNTWLKANGYLTVRNPRMRDDPGLFYNVDWSRTRAYGLGFNGLYVNLRGRERHGIVDAAAKETLVEEVAGKLLEVVDPATGQAAVTKVYRRQQVYRDGLPEELAPDLVVGYAKGTRCSNDSAIGAVSPEIFSDNTEWWSGDHGMDHEAVPGILLTNGPLKKPAPSLDALTGAILAEFGIEGES